MSNHFLRHRVAKNAIGLFVVQGASYLAPMLVLPYLAHVLGIERYGVVAFNIGIVQISSVVLDLGFAFSATQKISVWRDRRRYVGRLIGAIFLVKVFAVIVVASSVALYAVTTQKYVGYSGLFLLSLLPIIGQCFQPTWFFSGIEKMRYIAIVAVVSKVVYATLILLLVSAERDYLWVPAADGVAQIAAMFLSVRLIYRLGYVIERPRYRDVKYVLKMTAGVFASRTAASAFQTSGVFLLGLFSTPASVAAYSLAEQLYRAIQQVFTPIVLAIYPYMAREKNIVLLGKIAIAMSITAIAFAVGAFLALPLVLSLLLDADWNAVVPVFDVLALAITVNVLSAISGYPLAAVLGSLKVANTSVIYGGLVYVLLALVLILRDQVTPVAFAWLVLIAETYVLLHRIVLIWPKAYQYKTERTANVRRR